MKKFYFILQTSLVLFSTTVCFSQSEKSLNIRLKGHDFQFDRTKKVVSFFPKLNPHNKNKVESTIEVDTIFQTYPSAAKLNHPNIDFLSNLYTIVTKTSLDELEKFSNKGIFDVIEINETQNQLLHIPNDYKGVVSGSQDWALNSVNAPMAWDISKGVPSVKIAVLDANFKSMSHYDIEGKVEYFNGDLVSSGDENHGIWVGVISAGNTNNGKGGSSIGYNSKLLFYQAFNYNNMLEAASRGARVINCSWLNRCSPSASEQMVINTVSDLGVVVVAASGNGSFGSNCGGYSEKVYPASYENVISVTGYSEGDLFEFTNNTGVIGTFNHNNAVDLSAPGVNVPVGNIGQPNSMTGKTGTSFASPIVAGTVALMLAESPCLTSKEVEYILKTTANASINNKPENINFSQSSGAGKLDSYKSVEVASRWPESILDFLTISGPSLVCTSNTTFSLQNLPANATVSWSVPWGMAIVGANNGSSVTVRTLDGYYVDNKITATITTGNCNPIQITKAVKGGTPFPSFTGMLKKQQYHNELIFTISNYYPGVSTSWKVNGSNSSAIVVAPSCTTSPYPLQTYYEVELSYTNSCGTVTNCQKFVYTCKPTVSFSSLGMCEPIVSIVGDETLSVYPNPVNDLLFLELSAESEVIIYNKNQETVYSNSQCQGKVEVPTDRFPAGVYFLTIANKEGVVQRQLVVEH